MKETGSLHALLQGLINCYLERDAATVLRQWAEQSWKLDPQVSMDESCLKYVGLVVLDALAHKAKKIILEMGCPVLIVADDAEHMLPAAPESMLARGLEILREICGMEGPRARGTLALGIGNDSLEFHIEKSEAVHIMYLPDLS